MRALLRWADRGSGSSESVGVVDDFDGPGGGEVAGGGGVAGGAGADVLGRGGVPLNPSQHVRQCETSASYLATYPRMGGSSPGAWLWGPADRLMTDGVSGARPRRGPTLGWRNSEAGWWVMRRELRASNAEREAVVARLARALGEGRITVVEFDERVQMAYAARMSAELAVLTGDLPPSIW